MSKLIFFVSIILGQLLLEAGTLLPAAVGKIIVISDLDDTLIHSDVQNKINMIKNFLSGRPHFSHLKNIYRDIHSYGRAKNEATRFYYVSNSLKWAFNGKGWLKQHGLPSGKVIQRNSLWENGKKFKKKRILDLLTKEINSGQSYPEGITLLMFGDNGEYDPEIYQEVAEEIQLPLNSTVQILIRDVKVQKSPVDEEKIERENDSIHYFLSEWDLLEISSIQNMMGPQTKLKLKNAKFSSLVPTYIRRYYDERKLAQYCSFSSLGHNIKADHGQHGRHWQHKKCRSQAKHKLQALWKSYFSNRQRYLFVEKGHCNPSLATAEPN